MTHDALHDRTPSLSAQTPGRDRITLPVEELPTFAFPYSPATTDRGALYEFCLNHVMRLDDPMQAFRLEVTDARG